MDEKGPTMDSKFRRVLVAAGRAEQLMRGARPKVEAGKRKPTRVALDSGRRGAAAGRGTLGRQRSVGAALCGRPGLKPQGGHIGPPLHFPEP
ncbi:MAG: hypothetical protein DMF53_01160 [Acidobacteria bacterium]|nr:MAG: hypothetical protein DMF53_01160 [Acidobacteriota bacterium]